jgi:hypothetical protein
MDARMQAAALALAASASLAALADGADRSAVPSESAVHRRGDHPAVIVSRLEKDKPYDYASKFYPHPARLEVVETPHPLGDHPAVIVSRMQKDKGYDYAAQFYPHPARFAMLPTAPPEATAAPVAAGDTRAKVAGTSATAKAAASAPAGRTGATAVVAGATPARD